MAPYLYHSHDDDSGRWTDFPFRAGDVATPALHQDPHAVGWHPARRAWIDADPDPLDHLDSFPGFAHHLTDAWTRRHDTNVVLVHYPDLTDDLEREMRRIAERLGIDVPAAKWPDLVRAACFDAMHTQAKTLAPDPADILVDHAKFFRRGESGSGRALLSDTELERYHHRAARLMPAELVDWLHRSPADERTH